MPRNDQIKPCDTEMTLPVRIEANMQIDENLSNQPRHQSAFTFFDGQTLSQGSLQAPAVLNEQQNIQLNQNVDLLNRLK